ncbi:MAG: hypothetical protein P8Z42_03600 [Anaerolineales bacterium]
MVEIIWQFVVREECRGQFELAYGPGGAWSKLFSDSPGFRGTALLRDENDPKRYLTVDMWDSVGQRERWLFERKDEYTKMDATFSEWTESEMELGTFRVLAEGTVRPRGGARRSRH